MLSHKEAALECRAFDEKEASARRRTVTAWPSSENLRSARDAIAARPPPASTSIST
jgi:hypothetical protein